MNKDMLAQYTKEYLSEVKQTLIRVNDSLKKLAIGFKIKPLDFKRVGLESG
jgi:phosphoribosylaminoimidazole-succinocarboxamide synthase